jgi:hypothetical protein
MVIAAALLAAAPLSPFAGASSAFALTLQPLDIGPGGRGQGLADPDQQVERFANPGRDGNSFSGTGSSPAAPGNFSFGVRRLDDDSNGFDRRSPFDMQRRFGPSPFSR